MCNSMTFILLFVSLSFIACTKEEENNTSDVTIEEYGEVIDDNGRIVSLKGYTINADLSNDNEIKIDDISANPNAPAFIYTEPADTETEYSVGVKNSVVQNCAELSYQGTVPVLSTLPSTNGSYNYCIKLSPEGLETIFVTTPGIKVVEEYTVNTASTATATATATDITAPTNGSITIVDIEGYGETNKNTVDLTLAATGASQMLITNTPACTDTENYQTYASSKSSWPHGVSSNGTITVYAQFKDEAGNKTDCFSATIDFDNIAPVAGLTPISISSGNQFTIASTALTLGLSATGADLMSISNDSSCPGGDNLENYSGTKTGWTLGQLNQEATVYVQFRDFAGNTTDCLSDTIIHDNIAPTPGTIDGDFGDGSISWTAATDTGSEISHYKIKIGTSTGANDILTSVNVGSDIIYSVDSSGFSSDEYFATLEIVDNAGNSSQLEGLKYDFEASISQLISAGDQHTCVVYNAGAKCFGINNRGQLGNATNDNTSTPTPAPTDVIALSSGVTDITVGYQQGCAIQNGALKCWGNNIQGKLGNPDNSGVNISNITPLQVTGMTTGVTGLSAGEQHTCAIQNGAVKCFGSNTLGQLGNPTNSGASNTANPTPLQVTGLTSGVTRINSGTYHTCAIQNDAVKCWGRNVGGQLGFTANGTANPTPAAITGLSSGVIDICSGANYSCAIQNGSAKCWGENQYGQLGNATNSGTNTPNLIPLQVDGLSSGVTAIACYNNHTCAITNGGLKCWGRNFRGEIGNIANIGGGSPNPSPLQVTGMTSGVTAVTAGHIQTCAIQSGGLKCWGRNQFGELGNPTNSGTADNNTSPLTVTGLGSGF